MSSVYGLLYDQSKCVGCKACEYACQSEHDQPLHDAVKLDQDTFNWVQSVGKDTYQRHMCMHCENPTCASVCPVAALQKTHQGPVIWIASICMGCRYCMMACPFSIPKYQWHSVNPQVRKCDMCFPKRVSKGEQTACASICPMGATTFGYRKDLLEEAKRRVKADPKTYTGVLFGEEEAGGTGVLMLLTKSAAENGLPTNVPKDELPNLTWKVLEKLPVIIPVWAVFLGGMYWLTDRKNELAKNGSHGNGEGNGHA